MLIYNWLKRIPFFSSSTTAMKVTFLSFCYLWQYAEFKRATAEGFQRGKEEAETRFTYVSQLHSHNHQSIWWTVQIGKGFNIYPPVWRGRFFIDIRYVSARRVRRSSFQPVCGDLQSQILNCYRQNAGKTLDCSSIASAYIQCVHHAKKVEPNLFCCLSSVWLVSFWPPLGLQNKLSTRGWWGHAPSVRRCSSVSFTFLVGEKSKSWLRREKTALRGQRCHWGQSGESPGPVRSWLRQSSAVTAVFVP